MVSEDFVEEMFCCDISKCKGACCVEGDAGAPLEEKESGLIKEKLEKVLPLMSKEAIEVLEKEGHVVRDREGDLVTPTIGNRECIYAIYDENNNLKCSFEQVWDGSDEDFKKPISCHLYPARETKLFDAKALNYHRWQICESACDHGSKIGLPLYKFLKSSLTRKYGEEWYTEFAEVMEEIKKGP